LKTISLSTAIVLLAVVGCSKSEPPKDQPGTMPGAPVAAPVKPSDWSAIDKAIVEAKVPDDFDKIYAECMSLGLEVAGAKKLSDVKVDPDYFTHCEAALARAEAKIAIKNSKPGKMDSLCIAASMKTEGIAGSDKAEAAEFKKLDKDVKKACGL